MSGVILYEGPSVLTGDRIVCIATGIGRQSRNEKTGTMIQTWILRFDVPPTDAVKEGSDDAICGSCPLRGDFKTRRCYVNVGQGPLAVWRAYQRGSYPLWNGEDVGQDSRPTRLGAYGDPAAVPTGVWDSWLDRGEHCGWAGYTHQWAHPNFDARILDYCMASVENEEGMMRLAELHPDARYFRVRAPDEERIRGEMQCPASAEAGKKLTCSECLACSGAGKDRRSVSIAAHGKLGFEKNWV